MDMIRKALIADDHGLYRAGLRLVLEDQLDCAGVVETSSFDEALDHLARQDEFELALFDLSMPGMHGPETLATVRETYPDLKVAIVSASEDREVVLRAVGVGLNGFVPKSLSSDAIVAALKSILDGKVFVPRLITEVARPPENIVLDRSNGAAGRQPAAKELTPRQRDVLNSLARGLSNKEIARDLDIAEGTVKIHLSALFLLFGARNRTELVTLCQKRH